jgi:hypothetical protein
MGARDRAGAACRADDAARVSVAARVVVRVSGRVAADRAPDVRAPAARPVAEAEPGAPSFEDTSGAGFGKHTAHRPSSRPWIHSLLTPQRYVRFRKPEAAPRFVAGHPVPLARFAGVSPGQGKSAGSWVASTLPEHACRSRKRHHRYPRWRPRCSLPGLRPLRKSFQR